jgi:hypothetical protein
MLRFGTEYVDRGQDYYECRYQRRVVSNLMRRAHDLGYTLVKNEDLYRRPVPRRDRYLEEEGDIKPVERNRFAVEGVEPDRSAVRESGTRRSS